MHRAQGGLGEDEDGQRAGEKKSTNVLLIRSPIRQGFCALGLSFVAHGLSDGW